MADVGDGAADRSASEVRPSTRSSGPLAHTNRPCSSTTCTMSSDAPTTASNQPPLPGAPTSCVGDPDEREHALEPGLGEEVEAGEHDRRPTGRRRRGPGRDTARRWGAARRSTLERGGGDLVDVVGVDELEGVGADQRRCGAAEELRQPLVDGDGGAVPVDEGGGDRDAVEEVVTRRPRHPSAGHG